MIVFRNRNCLEILLNVDNTVFEMTMEKYFDKVVNTT
jgi:hypothetical protein